jgi:hypothetical protein
VANKRFRFERGQTLPLVAFAMVVLVGCASLAIDVGMWRYQQRLAQTAADSAAVAGATELAYTSSLASITTSAQTDAATNGFTSGSGGATVTVNSPPKSGGYAGNTQAVEVIVTKSVPVHFAALFGQGSTTVRARAVGLLTSANRPCIYALDTDSQAITENNATMTLPKCGIISNGGLLFNQGTIDAASIGYAGSTKTVNNTVFTSAAPKASVPAADPCPLVSGCAYLKANPPTSGSCATQTTFNSSSTMTIPPGIYCSELIIEGGGSVVFSPGVFTLQQGMVTNGSPPSISGSGVTFYVQGGNIIIDGQPSINLSAPSSGNEAGVLVYQPASNTNQFIINAQSGSSSGGWAGMIYVPGATLILDGQMSTWMMVVADDITINGTASISDSNSTFPNFAHAVLAE